MIEDGPKPVIAAIKGFAVGGGLEMTLACHSRIAHSNAKFLLPDLHIGIIPGLGGSQRLPRLVGVRKALEILWMTRPLTALEALEAGLVDEVIVNGDVLAKACHHALEVSDRRFPWRKTLERIDRLEPVYSVRHILRQARAQVKRDHPHVVHPLLCIDVIEEGILKGGLIGSIMEEKLSHGLIFSQTAKSLMHVFFARKSSTKIPGICRGLKPRRISSVAVVGCSPTAVAIATCFVLSKIPVLLKGETKADVQAGMNLMQENLKAIVTSRSIPQKEDLAALITTATNYEQFNQIDLVIEVCQLICLFIFKDYFHGLMGTVQALEENPSNLYSKLKEYAEICNSNCVFASNSPFIGSKLTEPYSTNFQNRIIGMHFLSPAYKFELVEISTFETSSSQAVLDVHVLVNSMKKLPLVIKSSAGLIVDRLCFVHSMGMMMLDSLGVDRARIHSCLREFGITMFSFSFSEFQRRMLCPNFDCYFPTGNVSAEYKDRCVPEENILDMLLFPTVKEALNILKEGIVETAEQIDIASILGMGFPSYRGGILFWANSVGIDFIISRLLQWSQQYGNFFSPCSLQDMPIDQVDVHVSDQIMARL